MILSKKFIKATDELCSFEKHINAPYFRRSFNIDFIPARAEITICGLGFYELYINGKNITKGPLAPYISNTDDICYYDCYDIADYICKGENVIGIILGNGFRNPFGGFVWDFDKSPSNGPLCAALAVECYGEGKRFLLEADENFLTHPSPILLDDLRMGYRYDSRLEIKDWNCVGFDAHDWKKALVCDTPLGEKRLCTCSPVTVRRKILPVSTEYFDKLAFAHESAAAGSPEDSETVRSDVYVFDFGINTAGVTQLKINGYPGQKITIRHGEHLVDGKFDMVTTMFKRDGITQRYYEYGQCDVFICSGGEEVFTPKFKYDGFQYAYVEGLLPEQVKEDTVVCLEMTANMRQRASFTSSDETLNKLQQMTEQADRANFLYFPTDCPHREKNGWTGDASLSAEQLILNFDCRDSFREWMRNIVKAQNAEGAIPGIVPTGGWGFEWGNGPAWDAVMTSVPYYIYKYYGDLSVFEECADMIDRYLHYAAGKRDEYGLVAFGLGDWCDPFARENDGKIAAPLELTDSITVFDMAKKAEKLFKAANMTEKSDYAKELAAQLKAAIRKNLISTGETAKGECQTSQAMMIKMGLFEENEIGAAQRKLVDIIHRDGDINTCGILGMRCLLHVLVEAGETELAYNLIVNTSRTCFGYWVKNGFTALCESFKGIDSPKIDSRNHHFFGDISSFMIRKIAGVQPNPTCDDYNSFVIKPHIPEKMTFAEGRFDREDGALSCRWEKQNGKIIFNISVPQNMHGSFIYGSLQEELTGGNYMFEMKEGV